MGRRTMRYMSGIQELTVVVHALVRTQAGDMHRVNTALETLTKFQTSASTVSAVMKLNRQACLFKLLLETDLATLKTLMLRLSQ